MIQRVGSVTDGGCCRWCYRMRMVIQRVGGDTKGGWCYRKWMVLQKVGGVTEGGW